MIASLSVFLTTNPSITSRSFTKPTVPSKAFSNSFSLSSSTASIPSSYLCQSKFAKNSVGFTSATVSVAVSLTSGACTCSSVAFLLMFTDIF